MRVIRWSDIKKMKLSLLDVYSIKFESLLLVISLYVVGIDAWSVKILRKLSIAFVQSSLYI